MIHYRCIIRHTQFPWNLIKVPTNWSLIFASRAKVISRNGECKIYSRLRMYVCMYACVWNLYTCIWAIRWFKKLWNKFKKFKLRKKILKPATTPLTVMAARLRTLDNLRERKFKSRTKSCIDCLFTTIFFKKKKNNYNDKIFYSNYLVYIWKRIFKILNENIHNSAIETSFPMTHRKRQTSWQ